MKFLAKKIISVLLIAALFVGILPTNLFDGIMPAVSVAVAEKMAHPDIPAKYENANWTNLTHIYYCNITKKDGYGTVYIADTNHGDRYPWANFCNDTTFRNIKLFFKPGLTYVLTAGSSKTAYDPKIEAGTYWDGQHANYATNMRPAYTTWIRADVGDKDMYGTKIKADDTVHYYWWYTGEYIGSAKAGEKFTMPNKKYVFDMFLLKRNAEALYSKQEQVANNDCATFVSAMTTFAGIAVFSAWASDAGSYSDNYGSNMGFLHAFTRRKIGLSNIPYETLTGNTKIAFVSYHHHTGPGKDSTGDSGDVPNNSWVKIPAGNTKSKEGKDMLQK